jgi:hypothetical protein
MTYQDEGHYKAKHSHDTALNPQIADAVRKSTVQGKLSCAEASRIADRLEVPISEVGLAADLMELKIEKCMLGLFGYKNGGMHGKCITSSDSVDATVETELHKKEEDGHIGCENCWTIADRCGISKMTIASACDTLSLKISGCQLGAF